MNILRSTENKPIIYIFVVLFFICQGAMLQNNSKFVGFGFGFLFIMSLFTTNIVYCITGSFVLTFIAFIALPTTTENFEDNKINEECKPTCFAMSTDYELKMRDVNTRNKTLSLNNESLKTSIALNDQKFKSLQIQNAQLTDDNVKCKKILKQVHDNT